MGLMSHILGGGDQSTFGDEDLRNQHKLDTAAYNMQQMMPRVQEQIGLIQNDDLTDDAAAFFQLSQMGADEDMLGMMFPNMAPSEDTDIMRTTKAYVDSYNAKNEGKEGHAPMTFDEGYDVVKNYDAARRGAQTSATEIAKSDVGQYGKSRDAYITAVEQDAIINDRITNVDRGLEMLESGSTDTGPVVGWLASTFGMGPSDLGELQQMSIEEAMEALQIFKGPTTDFEFTKAEMKGFASIFTGEDMNIGTLKSARNSLERLKKRNMLSGMSHLDAVGEYGTREQGDRLRNVFATPESWVQGRQPSGGSALENASPEQLSQFELWKRNQGSQ